MRTQRAIKKCAEWLVECLRLGWSRDQFDALEALWWQYHDDQGNLTRGVSVLDGQTVCENTPLPRADQP